MSKPDYIQWSKFYIGVLDILNIEILKNKLLFVKKALIHGLLSKKEYVSNNMVFSMNVVKKNVTLGIK